MSSSKKRVLAILLTLAMLVSTLVGALPTHGEASAVKQITILHTNDFHGNLEPDSSGRGGAAYLAGKINAIRAEVGAANVALIDAGDVYFGGAPISALTMGESAIDVFTMMGYQVGCYGNHEFDKGQTVLAERTAQSGYPWVGANVVVEGTEWDHPAWVQPYTILNVGPVGDQVKLGIIGLSTDETPVVTLKGTTDGIVFKDPTAAVLHYYDEVMAQADALIVLAHVGTNDSGPYKGLKTIAQELINAGKPVDLMIGGHQHEQITTPIVVGGTRIVEAYYAGRNLGRVTATIDPATKKLTVDAFQAITINNTLPADPDVAARVAYWKGVVAPIMAQPVGTTNVSLIRDYNAESNIGDLVADSMLWKADEYDDGEVNGSVQVAFTNAGGLRADLPLPDGTPLPAPLTWGQTFSVLPFANTLFVMDLTGYQIQKLLDQSATLYKGHLQVAGVEFFYYNKENSPNPTAWGAYGVKVGGALLDYKKTYRVVTNNFLATGGDNFVTFSAGKNRVDTYYDMQQALNEYIVMYNNTKGPIDYAVSGRIKKLDKVVTVLHTNDEHGRAMAELNKGVPQGMGYVSSLIKAERAKNPNVLLFSAGDLVQGNSFAFYYRNAPGATPGGSTALPNPMIAVLNALHYDAATFGNHEFNFGPASFHNYQTQSTFPWLAGNLHDSGAYGVDYSKVIEYKTFAVDGMKVGVLGMTNPRVPSYELPSNIPGLTFEGGYETAVRVLPKVQAENPDLVVSIQHLGYAPYEGSRAEDTDVFVAENVPGIDVLIGGHSHTKLDPAVLVTSATNPHGTLIAQAERYAGYLGKVNVGYVAKAGGGYEMVLREGRLLPAGLEPADPAIATLLDPYQADFNAYTGTVIGNSTTPLDTRTAFYEETGGSNLQADAAVWALEKAGIHVDIHLSGAMTNQSVAAGQLKVQDMFTLMPYENSLLVLRMNGPQIKKVLERSFFNYDLWRKGEARYTTCFLDTNHGRAITFDPTVPEAGDNVLSLTVDGVPVDFDDATKFYNVSTVNYLAAGACQYSDSGVTIWPLDQTVADTQLYVRDVVIDYIKDKGTVSPQYEGRVRFLKAVALLHTNDFHGNLEPDSSGRGGSAYIAQQVNLIRNEYKAENVALLDGGDIFFGGAPISALLMGEPAIDIYNRMGYVLSGIGNHEFDKGQAVLQERVDQADFPFVSANIVVAGTDWDSPAWVKPYHILTLGSGTSQVKIGVIGLTTDETPNVTLRGTTDGIVFKDMTAAVLHYYDEVAAQADAVILLAHMGKDDSAGFKGMKTVAQELIDAGKPVPLIISGHAHEALEAPVWVGHTAIVQANYAGRKLGRIDVVIDPWAKTFTIKQAKLITINNKLPADKAIADRVQYWADLVAPILAEPVGTAVVDLVRNYNGESNMGNLVADSMLWKADEYDDGVVNGSVQVAFTNAGGLRADIKAPAGAELPYNLTWGDTFSVLPFANTLFLMDLTGAQIQSLVNQAATLYKGILQSSGITWRWYNDCGCATPTESYAYDVRIGGHLLDPAATYRVVTNNFLATGGDNFSAFNQGTNRWDTYFDMQLGLNEYIEYYNQAFGPIDHAIDGRIQFTVNKAQDTFIDRYDQRKNYAAEPLIQVGWKRQYAGLITFPFKLPAGAVVDSAALQLYAKGWSGDNLTVSAYAVRREWVANEATFTHATSLVPWGAPGCSNAATDRFEPAEWVEATVGPRRWYSFDVTDLAQAWVNGEVPNYGVLLEADPAVATYFFASSENGDVAVRPRLVIRWH
ncbi:MAG: Trifunctional nucleotide phosphoesterase protein YfkN precursor [Chloroflexi bacterium ADurb.Bin180]|nr:MAG: Trifunctional nucleotide phosphoesterase protein YfkN precursor [Chloroflexi bacterium ADurb.Bin180]